jgi:hypothetical protein
MHCIQYYATASFMLLQQYPSIDGSAGYVTDGVVMSMVNMVIYFNNPTSHVEIWHVHALHPLRANAIVQQMHTNISVYAAKIRFASLREDY